jgi:hypothetical protein
LIPNYSALTDLPHRWPIRNSGLILLRSIFDRLFGTSDGKAAIETGWDGKSVKLQYDAYGNMASLLDNLLEGDPDHSELLEEPNLGAVQLVLPALDMIRRGGPPPSHQKSIFKSVTSHLGSRIWHVREQAAKTICTMMRNTEWNDCVLALLETPTNSANRRHGLLIAARTILERRWLVHLGITIGNNF